MSVDQVDAFIAHYGVKGMRWGVIREDKTGGESSGSSKPKTGITKKKVMIVGSIVIGTAAVATGAYFAAKHYDVKLSSLKKSTNVKAVKDLIETHSEEPTGIIHASRGKNRGFRFLTDGGVKDPLLQLQQMKEQTGIDFSVGVRDTLVRFGARNEKIFASFADPKGRRDRAGRPITHDVILPELRARGIETLQQVKDSVWRELETAYDEFYDSTTPGMSAP